jgi:hypothetical protein
MKVKRSIYSSPTGGVPPVKPTSLIPDMKRIEKKPLVDVTDTISISDEAKEASKIDKLLYGNCP